LEGERAKERAKEASGFMAKKSKKLKKESKKYYQPGRVCT
jgi:hypothetical protein